MSKKQIKKKYRPVGCYEINPHLAVVVSVMESGKICITQRTAYKDDETGKVNYVYKHGSSLRLNSWQYRELLNMLIDLDI